VFLIALAAVLSLVPLLAEKRQGNSIRWTVDGDQIHCEYFQIPSFSHVRAYSWAKIEEVSPAPDSQNPEVSVVRFQLSGLNLNIPSQSSDLIWNFDTYLEGLQSFMERVRDGDSRAAFTWYHPWLVIGFGSAAAAALLWVVVFTVLLLGRRRSSLDGTDGRVESS
jgi:hypothetical protein